MSDEPVNINLDELKELIRLLRESNVSEFEIRKPDYRLRIKQGGMSEPVVMEANTSNTTAPANGTALTAIASSVASVPPPPPVVEEGLQEVRSPMVGTFYRSATPGAASFVEVGDRVRKGQVLCIIEAMKIMNEIESDSEGEIRGIHASNGQPVEFGEALFTIKPVA